MGTVGIGGGGMWQREYRLGMAQSYTSSEAWFLVSSQCAFSRCAQKMGLAQKSTSLIGLTPLPSPTLVLFLFLKVISPRTNSIIQKQGVNLERSSVV